MAWQVTTPYGFGLKTTLPYDQAIERTKAALKEEGFGVLTEIDVRRTLKEKLGAEFRPYVILGACNPPLAHQAFQAELNIGLLLPCNVVVYEEDAGSVVAAMDPEAALGIAGREDLRPLATEVRSRLERALGKLAEHQTRTA
jgi:uncharacterized protein (DUF302 family)